MYVINIQFVTFKVLDCWILVKVFHETLPNVGV